MSDVERGIDPGRQTAVQAASRTDPGRWPTPGGLGAAERVDLARSWIGATLEREMEAGRGFLWLPVIFGIGILVYFTLPAEPSMPALIGATALLILAALVTRAQGRVVAFRTVAALAALSAGVTATKLRTDLAAAPVIAREMTVHVTGWVSEREAASGGGVRIHVRVHDIEGLPAARTPWTARITIRTRADGIAVGDALTMLARLKPPSGPVMPGGFDFGLADFYDGVGAVGFAYGAAQPADIGPAPLPIRLGKPIADLRDTIRRRIIAALPGDRGEIAAALVMGDQRGITEKTQDAMRASGLGHVLSISGLHMALVAGSAFWLIRALLALFPGLALRRPIKKWAAAGGLAVATFYLTISGANVATERSYVMLVVILVAVMIDRRAITVRNVAVAACIVLVIEPESLLSASFQMSFAATLALVAGYEAIRARAESRLNLADLAERGIFGRFWSSARGLILTSLIASLATAPFAIYHFQRAAPLSLLANLAAMPVVGVVIMPMALLSMLVMPFGLEALPLAAMGWGIDWMIFVANTIAGWSEGWGGVRAAPATALLLFVAGFLWLALWGERWRIAGLVPILVAVPVALFAPRPDILIDAGGRTAAVRGADGRYSVIGAKDAQFTAEYWLRADADSRSVDDDLAAGVTCDGIGCIARLADGAMVAVSLKPAAFADDCRMAAVVISRYRAPTRCAETATVIDRDALAEGGAQALFRLPGTEGAEPQFRIETAYPPGPRRPFMPPVSSGG